MSCRIRNVDDCLANDTLSFAEIFSNENLNDTGYWSGYPEIPKLDEKIITYQNPCAMQFTQIVKKRLFFFSK